MNEEVDAEDGADHWALAENLNWFADMGFHSYVNSNVIDNLKSCDGTLFIGQSVSSDIPCANDVPGEKMYVCDCS